MSSKFNAGREWPEEEVREKKQESNEEDKTVRPSKVTHTHTGTQLRLLGFEEIKRNIEGEGQVIAI